DGDTRAFAATLPLFFLWPASGVGGLYKMIAGRVRQVHLESNADFEQNTAICSAAVIGGTLSLVIILSSWALISTSSVSKSGPHPVRSMIDKFVREPALVCSVDLRSLRAGYHLRLTDDTEHTWLPDISRRDFARNVPRLMGYLSLSEAFNRLPP